MITWTFIVCRMILSYCEHDGGSRSSCTQLSEHKHKLYGYITNIYKKHSGHTHRYNMSRHNMSQNVHSIPDNVHWNLRKSANTTVPISRLSREIPLLQNVTKIVIIFPYRNRHTHYVRQMRNLQKHYRSGIEFTVYVIEQKDILLAFRRAWLLNIGIHIAATHSAEDDCIVTHDVDMQPNQAVDYTWCNKPTLLCAEISCFGGGIPYAAYAGGVVSATTRDWRRINGYTNTAYGWGGEDDDLYYRFKANHLDTGTAAGLRRPSAGRGVCMCDTENDHTPREKNQTAYNQILEKLRRMQHGSDEWKKDGLNNLNYHLLGSHRDEFGSHWIAVSSEQPIHRRRLSVSI